MHIKREIERFLDNNDMAQTRFGRLAVSDPRFVGDLRNGREPRPETIVRVRKFMASYQGEGAPA